MSKARAGLIRSRSRRPRRAPGYRAARGLSASGPGNFLTGRPTVVEKASAPLVGEADPVEGTDRQRRLPGPEPHEHPRPPRARGLHGAIVQADLARDDIGEAVAVD